MFAVHFSLIFGLKIILTKHKRISVIGFNLNVMSNLNQVNPIFMI